VNWLAHVFLSEDDCEARLGNLLADAVRRPDQVGMSDAFLRGVRRHYAIDSFTDSHSIVHRSRSRLRHGYGHARGIIIDVFYDHALAGAWDRYSDEPLDAFTHRIHTEFQDREVHLPPAARATLDYIIREDRLRSYRTIQGIETALRGISRRLSARLAKPFALERAAEELAENLDQFQTDFAEFFPLLQAHVKSPAINAA
jgi:acyl carrier protein phosphodiesterase